MPYFVRMPYAATQPSKEADEVPDILALAADVLAHEAGATTASPFRVRKAIRPGTTGSLVLGFTAEQAPASIRLSASDLTGPGGIIPAQSLTIDPQALALHAGETADVTVSVGVPVGTTPGLYRGRIAAAGSDGFTAPIELTVEP